MRYNKLHMKDRDTIKSALQKGCYKLKRKISTLENQLQTVTEEREATNDATEGRFVLQTRTKQGHNEFTGAIRKTMICLQGEGNVAASKCRDVVKIVANQLLQQNLTNEDLPCTQSILNMADEGHVISKMQTTEAILESRRYTLHTDGTSRDHNTIVGQQITHDNGVSMSLGFRQVASENASTLLDITMELLKELGDVYCTLNEEQEKEDIFKKLLKKMNSLMSDRAAVMKNFNEKLKAFIQSELGEEITMHFLYCNAHYLLGLSRACELCLKGLEKVTTEESETP